jgi:hypothetical protein
MTSYSVFIKLGSLTWDIAPGDGVLADEDEVLDSLSFGWSMPEGLWPLQPDPMQASLAINVPDFTSDIAALVEGDVCTIEVSLIGDEPFPTIYGDTCAFHGRITDLRAVPRSKREGVTLSIAAVDYTVDLAELPQWAPTSVFEIEDLLAQLWSERMSSAFPTWPGPFEFGNPDIDPSPDLQDVPTRIEQQLLQATAPIDVTRTHRLILAPYIDPDTHTLDTGQEWTFDRVYKPPNTDPFVIRCSRIEKDSLEWLYSKESWPTLIEVNGPGNTETATHGAAKPRIARIAVDLVDSADVEAVADFYLPDPTPSAWRVNTFRFHATRGSGIDDDEFPSVLFPIWILAPDTPERSSCYGQVIELADVPWHMNPLAPDDDPPETTVTGRLTGASVTVAGGHVVFDFQLRQTAI